MKLANTPVRIMDREPTSSDVGKPGTIWVYGSRVWVLGDVPGTALWLNTGSAVVSWQTPVKDRDLSSPPGGESEGDRYIVGSSATGAWLGQTDKIAEFTSGAYIFITPDDGFASYVEDEDTFCVYQGTWPSGAWVVMGGGSPTIEVGVTPIIGTDKQILYVDGSVLGGSDGLTYSGTTLKNLKDFTAEYVSGANRTDSGMHNVASFNYPNPAYGQQTYQGGYLSVTDYENNVRKVLRGLLINVLDQSKIDETIYAAGYFRATSAFPPTDGEYVVVGSRTYTFRNVLSSEGDVKIGATMLVTLQNLMAAVNGTGTVGVEHQCTSANADAEVISVSTTGLPVIMFRAKVAGSAGDSIAFSESVAGLAPSSSGVVLLKRDLFSKNLYGIQTAVNASNARTGTVYGNYLTIEGSSYEGNLTSNTVGSMLMLNANGVNESNNRGSYFGYFSNINVFGGYVPNIYCFYASLQVVNDGSTYFGSAGNVYGLYVDPINGMGTGKIGNVYGVYISDLASVLPGIAASVYGLYIAGATQENYIEGNLTVAGNLNATIGAAGSDGQIQFNDGGAFAGDSNLTWTKSTDILGIKHVANEAVGAAITLTQSRGSGVPGQVGDVLGSIKFYGYNDATTPELVEFASIESGIAASNGAQDGLERGFLAFWAKANYDSTKAHPSLKIHQDMNYYMTYDFLGASGASGNKGIYIRSVAPNNTGTTIALDANGGGAQLLFTSNGAAYSQWYLGYDFNTSALVLNNVGYLSGIGDVMSWHNVSGNVNFYRGASATQPTSGVKNIVFGNGATAPSAILADAVIAWCADYAAGDARLYLMAEASTNKTIFGSGKIVFSDPNVNHGMTTYMATDEYFKIEETSAGLGGASIFAATDDYGVTPLTFKALLGNAASNDSCISFVFGVKSGSGITAYGAMGTPWCVAFYNNTTLLGGWVNDGFSVNGAAYIRIKDMDVGIQCTTLTGGAPYTCGQLSELHATNGGMQVLGLSGNKDQEALVVHGNLSSSTTPSDTTPALVLKGSKYSGSGFDPGALSASQTVMQILNYTTVLATLKGGNYWQLTNSTTAPGSIATDAVQLWCADYAAGDARLYIMGEAQTGKVILGNAEIQLDDPDVAHGMTSLVKTDTFARLQALSGTDGGLVIDGFSDTNDAVGLCLSGTAPAASYDGSHTLVKVQGYLKSSTTRGAPGNQTVVFGVWCQGGNPSVARCFAIYGDGGVAQESTYGLAHGMTGISVDAYNYPRTNTIWYGNSPSVNNGGYKEWSFSGNSATTKPREIVGVSGHASPTVPMICLTGGKKNSTNWQAIAATELVLGIYNYSTLLASMYGEGTFKLERVQYDPADLSDDESFGEVTTGTAGENLAQWDLCYLKSDGKYWKADANSASKMPGVVLATTAVSADASGRFLRKGWVRNDGWSAWTVGAPVYASGNAGEVTQTAPSAVGDQVQVVGFAYASKIIYFDPSSTVVEIGTGTIDLERVRFTPGSLDDDECYGELTQGTAGESLAQWDLCYMKSDGKYWKADANASTTMPGVVMATEAISADATGTFLVRGWVRNDGWTGWTVGASSGILYASGTAGAITQTAPSGAGDQVQVVGWAYASKIIRFEPQLVIVEV